MSTRLIKLLPSLRNLAEQAEMASKASSIVLLSATWKPQLEPGLSPDEEAMQLYLPSNTAPGASWASFWMTSRTGGGVWRAKRCARSVESLTMKPGLSIYVWAGSARRGGFYWPGGGATTRLCPGPSTRPLWARSGSGSRHMPLLPSAGSSV